MINKVYYWISYRFVVRIGFHYWIYYELPHLSILYLPNVYFITRNDVCRLLNKCLCHPSLVFIFFFSTNSFSFQTYSNTMIQTSKYIKLVSANVLNRSFFDNLNNFFHYALIDLILSKLSMCVIFSIEI